MRSIITSRTSPIPRTISTAKQAKLRAVGAAPLPNDEVMDWNVDALHQSHVDEKRFRQNAITRLQEEQSKLQNRLDKPYDDRLDGFIEPDFFEP